MAISVLTTMMPQPVTSPLAHAQRVKYQLASPYLVYTHKAVMHDQQYQNMKVSYTAHTHAHAHIGAHLYAHTMSCFEYG